MKNKDQTYLATIGQGKSEGHSSNRQALPFISIIIPAYNESAILEKNLQKLYDYLNTLKQAYRWELIVVNDGSEDHTGALADQFAQAHRNVKALHHRANRNLGGALQTGFRHAKGDYVVVLDIDLTYSESHIEKMMGKALETGADIVLASPYMKGGKSTSIPLLRLFLSKAVNRMMQIVSPVKIHTFTSMVRVYKADFLRKLNLKSITYSINPEIIYKALILRAHIEEIPAHLDWSAQKKSGRASSIRIFSGIMAGFMSGFIFRPYIFFMSIGLMLLLISLYIIVWIFIQTFAALPEIAQEFGNLENRFGMAVASVFQERPYSFIVGGITLIVALQFLGIGFLSLQSKRYFEELFHINTTILDKHFNERKQGGRSDAADNGTECQ